jgi:hypothetical protein
MTLLRCAVTSPHPLGDYKMVNKTFTLQSLLAPAAAMENRVKHQSQQPAFIEDIGWRRMNFVSAFGCSKNFK